MPTTREVAIPRPVAEERVVEAARAWAKQGARSKWSTPESLALYDAVQELEADFSEEPPTRPLCSICGFPQYDSPSGRFCQKGHGGAPSLSGDQG